SFMLCAIFFGQSAVIANLLDERTGPSDRGKRQNPITAPGLFVVAIELDFQRCPSLLAFSLFSCSFWL
ncbi:MAG: hypothetical protein WCF35_07605, partial [Pseudolabrys sp.]